MASIEKIINTRIQLKYDSYTNWTTNNPTLKSGEVAIAYLATAGAVSPATGATQHPVLFKVGPGAFNDLPWASALAADVHTWAKKTEAEFTTWVKGLIEVSDIDAYSKAEVDSKLAANSTADQKYAKEYADSLAPNYDAAGTAQGLINNLDVTDTAVTGKYVSAVSEEDGKISVTRADLPTYTLASGSANGTVAFNGADVAVTGLKSAAYTDSKDYATAAQGTKADSAVQSVTVLGKELTNGGSVSADEAKTALGLGSAAYENTDAFDAAGSASAVNTALETYKTSNDAAVAAVKATADAAATNAALEAEIARATQAEAKALTDAKAYTDDMKDALLGEGIKDTFDTLVEIQNWIEGDGVDATELSEAIAAEARTRGEEITRVEGLISDNADAIEALGITDGKVAAAAKADVASSLDEAGIAQVKGIKVDNAAHADKATDSDKLGGVAADQYALKTDAQGYANTAEQNAKDYADGLAGNYATAAQGAKADTALQAVTTTANNGLKVTQTGTTANIDIDEAVVFVLNCGSSSELVWNGELSELSLNNSSLGNAVLG